VKVSRDSSNWSERLIVDQEVAGSNPAPGISFKGVGMQTIVPRLVKGFRDLTPQHMLARQYVTDTIRSVYETYSFVPFGTPAVEYLDILDKGGTEALKGIFGVTSPEKEPLGLRYDLTVSLARYVAAHRDLPLPFRRFQLSPVWRADKPDKGRFREFWQFDIDSVGVPSEIADTEIVAAMCDVLEALRITGVVRISSRTLLNLLLVYAKVADAMAVDVFRVLDKLDKVGIEKVRLELTAGYVDESKDRIRGLGLSLDQVARIEAFLNIRSERRADVIAHLSELFASVEGARDAIDTLDRISRHLAALGYGDDRVKIDLSIARGLVYYTGPVFEANVIGAEKLGSIIGGGRYDDLVMKFRGERIPATGASIGVDRLLTVLEELGKLRPPRTTAQVVVANIDPLLTEDVLQMTWELRRAGIRTELYLGDATSMRKQLKYADTYDVPLTLLYGSEEKERGVVTVKAMAPGRSATGLVIDRAEWLATRSGQTVVPRADLTATVLRMLYEPEAPTSV
jgi:histidyl-tRNA synthetase